MTRIGLLSDTHGYLDDAVFKYFDQCDEIWHAGDFGNIELADQLAAFKPLRGVYGNIDDRTVRLVYPEHLKFTVEQVSVWMTHIGGYPGKYNPKNQVGNLFEPSENFYFRPFTYPEGDV